MGEYVKENLYTDIPGAGNVFTAGDQTWNQEKIRAYFCECFAQINVFNEKSEEFAKALMSFVNDENHTGEEADASKSFINDNLYAITVDTVRAVQILMGKMQGLSFESSVPLLEDFCEDLAEDDTAILNKSKLEKVIIDFAAYNRDFQDNTPTIKSLRDDAQSIVESCDVITVKTLDDPDPAPAQEALDDFVKNGKEGFVPTLMEKFLAFLDEHNDDFSGTEFVSLIDHINQNLKRIQDGLGDGSFDPETYAENLNNIVYEKAGDSEAYKAYIETYLKFVQGMASRCQVYCYDPVNMNTGNFISSKTDLKIGGRHGIEARRFYNAQSDTIGVLGRGWTLNYEMHLAKTDDETITVFYDDGKEGCFKKTNIGKEEVYLEIHGEEGILREKDNGYRLSYDNNKYIDFDSDGYVTSYGDNYGSHTTIDYDLVEKEIDGKIENRVLPIKVKTKEGSELVFSYNELGLLLSVKDHTGREVSYKYEDTKDKYRLTSITSPNGATRQFHYTEDGLIKEMVRPDGIVGVVNEYDSKKRIIHQTMPDGGEIKFSYDEDRHVTTAIEQNGCKVEYISDEIGRHVGTRYPEQDIEEKFTYNDRGFKTSHTDKRGYTTRYTYDNRGHLTGIIGPEGLHEFYTYDADGKLSARKDSNGNITKYKYDFEGNLCCVVDPLGGKIRYYYKDGKVVSIKDAEKNKIIIGYDNNGNISSITNPSGVTIRYENDNLGRVIATEDAEGNRTTYDIGVDDNIARVVDSEGNETIYEYTALGEVSSITNPDHTRKSWEYNAMGKLSAFTDEEGRTTRIYYNQLGKEEKIVLPNNGNISYEYDLLGNLTKVTDPDGRISSYTHDKNGNILTIKKADKTIEDDVDSASDAITVSSYTYDGLGRIKTVTDGNGNVTSYEYDNNGNITKVTDPNGGVIEREYDKAGRLVKETDAADRETLYAYDKNGNRKTTTDPNGVVTENTYENNRLVKITQKAGDEECLVGSYEYDSLGRVKSETQADGFVVSMEYTKT
ncbi:DUF6531 domain-containing protein, partial [Butyrivibrio proteoclasticus]|uniref:DUF6531 domain-containing protein n=1 Tax=Butyrivibrio proteoclasticus TaxID=43305 RepID=UPI0018CC7A33